MKIKSIRSKPYKGAVVNLYCTPDNIFQLDCGIFTHNCGAGDYFVRSLSTEEIVAQPVRLLNDIELEHHTRPNDIRRLQIMFMSMGEPLLNLKNLIPALRELYAKYPKARLLISTIGPKIDYNPLIEISKEIPTIGLQFSIHESTDEARDKLIPLKGKLSLEEISAMGTKWFEATGRNPFFNYCVHDKNNSDNDADRLQDLFHPLVWEATISVICERGEFMAAANARQRDLARSFQSLLSDRGFSTRVFDPAGQDDIGGGCGQLWFVQKWMRDNPDKAKPSVGHSLPVVHTPCACKGSIHEMDQTVCRG